MFVKELPSLKKAIKTFDLPGLAGSLEQPHLRPLVIPVDYSLFLVRLPWLQIQ